jgi:predicted metalloenzyme YecM
MDREINLIILKYPKNKDMTVHEAWENFHIDIISFITEVLLMKQCIS